MKKILILFAGLIMISSCMSGTQKKEVQLANPASEFCINKGGKCITVKEKGGDVGYCVFKDGSVCKQWDYFKGKCDQGNCAGSCRKGPQGEGYYDCSNNYYGDKPCIK